jgi:regulator of replication initiation timing
MPLPDKKSVGLNDTNRAATKLNTPSLAADDSIINAHVNSEHDTIKATKNLMAQRGTGTFFDIPTALIRALPPVKNKFSDEKYKNLLYSYQSKLIGADRQGGSKVAKGKLLKSLFTETDMLPLAHVTTTSGKKVDAFVPTDVTRLSAPVDKVKRLALPLLAVYGIGSIIDNKQKESSSSRGKREGDIVVQKAASFDELKSKLLDKIATTFATLNQNQPSGHLVKEVVAREKVIKAAELLKQASVTIDDLKDKLAEVSEENKTLKLQILAKERSQRAVKLAKDMVSRGMIKHAECGTQVDYIMGLDDEAFNLLNKTVNSVPVKQASAADSSVVDKLSYLLVEDTVTEKPSLADAILGMKV